MTEFDRALRVILDTRRDAQAASAVARQCEATANELADAVHFLNNVRQAMAVLAERVT